MFNKTVIVAGRPTTTNHYSTITEKRAPTDESVRLLKEFEEKAEAKVLKAMRLETNNFKAVIQKQQAFEVGDIVYVVIYELGGIRRVVKVNHSDLDDLKGVHWTENVLKALSEDIARNILEEAINKLPKIW
ncbi:hypothetical protein AU106_gp171 [Sinorhizobium phage phiM9]|uniref:Uncharacterized protein n=1 Tax=Sinorhizobium phage phiM9 TaxID=1636182 RepID=A0A0F6R528_9CAUD|nr:hypothetical protein AU106_gp171 [Sinorhizobium phage phiM9]AKE44802.1 hypothetical protein Sm_phiM9_174 [Sinorhizobium phage phiM9]